MFRKVPEELYLTLADFYINSKTGTSFFTMSLVMRNSTQRLQHNVCNETKTMTPACNETKTNPS